MTDIEFNLLVHLACDYDGIFEGDLNPIDPAEELRTDFKSLYGFPDFPSVLWAKQYLLSINEPFQIAQDYRDDISPFVILCNVPWR
jgi:hypothetical protein